MNMPGNQTSKVSSIKPASGQEPVPTRRTRARPSYRYQAKIRYYRLIIAAISVFFLITLLFTWLHNSRQSSEHDTAILDLRKQEVLAKELSKELEIVRNERDILIKQRIPGLTPLVYDEAINIDNEYVRNIIFTLAKSGKKNIYEYRLVLHNNTLTIARPKAEIILFNDVGVQIGLARIEQSDATIEKEARAALDPGEVRSYTAAIDLIRNEEPSYFLLVITEGNSLATEKLRQQLNGVLTPRIQ